MPARRACCAGLSKYGPDQAGMVAVGGLDLVDLDRNAPVHRVPVKLLAPPGSRDDQQSAILRSRLRCARLLDFAPEGRSDADLPLSRRAPETN